MMTEREKNARILHLMRIYGGDPARWPATEGLGQPVLNGDLKAAADEERVLDELIVSAQIPEPSAALRGRIMDIPRHIRHEGTGGWWILSGFWRPAGAAVFVLALGVLVGQTHVPVAQSTADIETELLFAELVLGPTQTIVEFPQ